MASRSSEINLYEHGSRFVLGKSVGFRLFNTDSGTAMSVFPEPS
ncbi:hypothetical protein JCM19235_1332 [Vibrio maritimus]|uniref:Uncharacterized protein n=1 Tax=Vibrio maritimus TaxID=990268 RepID=A0A090S673_9VIBR|nr:hypothetical protein JCM19235_1332 [Vibrio maritimus]